MVEGLASRPQAGSRHPGASRPQAGSLGVRVWDLWLRVASRPQAGSRHPGSGCRVQGSGFRGQSLEFMV